jgi:hypothetical protein
LTAACRPLTEPKIRQILREAQAYYVTRPDSEMETRLYIRGDGRVAGRRMLKPFDMASADGATWPIVDLDRTHPNGRGWMGFGLDQAFCNACRMRADYWNHRAAQCMEVA